MKLFGPTPISGIGGSEDPKLTMVARGADFELKVKGGGPASAQTA